VLAILRAGSPDSWNWLLLGHLLSAMLLVAGVITVMLASLAASRVPGQVVPLRSVAFWTNLTIVLPSFVGAYVFGGVLADKEYEEDPHWLEIAFRITDVALVLGGVGLTVLLWWVRKRARVGTTGGWPASLAQAAAPVLLAALVAVIVLMAGKP
jgi:hypothetical protein